MEPVNDPNHASDRQVWLKTKDGTIYELERWEVLANHDVRGSGRSKSFLHSSTVPIVRTFEGTISASSISFIGVEVFDGTKTALAAAGTAVCATGLYVVINALSSTGSAIANRSAETIRLPIGF